MRPIYRRGDRVLVKIPFGFCELTVLPQKLKSGMLWLYGVCYGFKIFFLASQIIRRVLPHQVFDWSKVE